MISAVKMYDIPNVREYLDELPVELWRRIGDGRLVIRAYAECGNACVDIDLLDIIQWAKSGDHI